jgi:hypothetical protein
MLFPTAHRARQRLAQLATRGVLARFRHYQPLGSRPWTYTLGLVGTAVRAVATGEPLPTPADITARILRLSHSPSLAHLIGVNEFFTRLHAAARTMPGAALTTWWPETTTAAACGGIVRPDGYGSWTQPAHSPHWTDTETTQPASQPTEPPTNDPTSDQDPTRDPAVIEFFYEHDTGTENLNILLGKIDKYEQLAAGGVRRTVLIELPTLARETNLHSAIRRRYGDTGPNRVPVATTHATVPATPPPAAWRLIVEHGGPALHRGPSTGRAAQHGRTGISPAGPLWWLVGTNHRYRLAALTTQDTHAHRDGGPHNA